MNNVLVLIDFSEDSLQSLKFTRNLFSQRACKFFLMHHVCFKNPSVNLETEKTKAKVKLTKVIEEHLKGDDQGVDHSFEILITAGPNLISAVRNVSKDIEITLIAIGHKGLGSKSNSTVQSNVSGIITQLRLPVVIVPKEVIMKDLNNLTFVTDNNIPYLPRTIDKISEIVDLGENTLVRILSFSKKTNAPTKSQKENEQKLLCYLDNYNAKSFQLANQSFASAFERYSNKNDLGLIIMKAQNLNILHQLIINPKIKDFDFPKKLPFLLVHN